MAPDPENRTLNWPALVEEAKRRRKEEGLTQKAHAALADVSGPTINSFDKGETSISLSKAMDILRVVGMVEAETPGTAQNVFVADCLRRWENHTKDLEEASPGRFPFGYLQYDYAITGDIAEPDPETLLQWTTTGVDRRSGWPLFIAPKRGDSRPRIVDNGVECRLSPHPPDGLILERGPDNCDYWRALPSGRFFMTRGHKEDADELLAPGSALDITLPIVRLAELILHASQMADLFRKELRPTVEVNSVYAGLFGRRLSNRSNPNIELDQKRFVSERTEVSISLSFSGKPEFEELVSMVSRAVSPLFAAFGYKSGLSDIVETELRRFLAFPVFKPASL